MSNPLPTLYKILLVSMSISFVSFIGILIGTFTGKDNITIGFAISFVASLVASGVIALIHHFNKNL